MRDNLVRLKDTEAARKFEMEAIQSEVKRLQLANINSERNEVHKGPSHVN